MNIERITNLNKHDIKMLINNFSENGWVVSERYIKMYISNKSNHVYCIKIRGIIVSSIFFSNYLNRGWIGYSFTKREFRGNGFNSLLKKYVFENFRFPIFLICSDELITHNEKLGLMRINSVYEIEINTCNNYPENNFEKIEEVSIEDITKFDCNILGGNREEKLRSIMSLEAIAFGIYSAGDLQCYSIKSVVNYEYRLGPIVYNTLDYGLNLLTFSLIKDKFYLNKFSTNIYEDRLKHLSSITSDYKIIKKYNLMSTSVLYLAEITNQLAFYGRATG